MAELQKSIFPMKDLGISATYNSTSLHKNASQGSPKSYPTDLCGKDKGKSGFYAPFDCKVLKVYNKASNGIWLRSSKKVVTPKNPKGAYIFLMLEHPTKLPKVGQTFKQGELITYEDAAGNATGNHIHLECAYSSSTSVSCYWSKNNRGHWGLRIGTQMKIEEAFFLDPSFTKIYNDKGVKFKTLTK